LLKKILAQIHFVAFEKNAPLIPKNDVTEPKARRLDYLVKKLPVKKLITVKKLLTGSQLKSY